MSAAIDTPVVLVGGTKIEWAHFTFNSWWGCARVSPACTHCYAETMARRYGHDVWGKTSDRRFFGDKHWAEPLKWNRKAERDGVRYRVFCASMADVFEDRIDLESSRARLWQLIAATPHLDWMLLTKRPENMAWMVPVEWSIAWPVNVWAGTTAEDQQRADERLPHLREVPASVRFISYEPALGPLDLDPTGLHLVIAGGESGPGARPAHPDWFRAVRDQCIAAGVAFHFKQWGDWAPAGGMYQTNDRCHVVQLDGRDRGIPWAGWGRDQPEAEAVYRFGKKAAGRELDGREWNEFPKVAS